MDATCGQNDNFCKEIGRKISLARALKELYPSSDDHVLNGLNKALRATFWGQYRIMPKKVDEDGNIKIIPRWKLNGKKIVKES